MFQHATKFTFESETCPGVTVTLKKLTVARRAEMDLENSDIRAEYFRMLGKAGEVKGDGDAERDTRSKLNVKAMAFEALHLKPIYIKACVSSLEGLSIDEAPATVDALLAEGPEDLCNEIYDVINRGFRMTGDEEKNSQPPSTSGQPEVGGNGLSTVITASE